VSNRIQDEILFGLIAVKEGFLTQELLDQALDIQERSTSTRGVTLGHILVELGFLKAEQVHQIVAIQNRNLAQRDPNTGEQRADSLFGRLAVKCGFTTADRMHECVRLQAELARKGSPARLGRLLVDKGWLTEPQVHHILKLQKTELIGCPKCGKWYNLKSADLGRVPPCKHCGGPLSFLSEIFSIDAEDLLAGAAETMPDPASPADAKRRTGETGKR